MTITSTVPAMVDNARPTPRQPVICCTGRMTNNAAVAIQPGFGMSNAWPTRMAVAAVSPSSTP